MRVEPPTRHDLVDLRRVEAASASACLVGPTGLLQQVFDELLELGAGQLHLQVLRSALIGGDERAG
jgi:hypothetical protein